MILTKKEIIKNINKKRINIEPFDANMLNPNSYNYKLGNELLEFDSIIDAKAKSNFNRITLNEEGYVLQPNKLYLAATYESIGSNKYVIQLIGRSSLARLGLFLQVTAPIGHIGTNHNWTLELKVVQPLKIYPYMKIGQVSFWKTCGKKKINYINGEYKKYKKPQISKFYKELI